MSKVNSDSIITIEDLSIAYPFFGGVFLRKKGALKAVDEVSLSIKSGEILGLVGESGSGKSTLGKGIMNVLRVAAPDTEISGKILFQDNGEENDLLALGRKELLPFRREIQMVFQDPYSSLNPRMIVQDIVKEPLDIHHPEMPESEKLEKVYGLLDRVGLSSEQAGRYPHEFSGGQRQRIGIARSLATNPKLIIADEPVSALDVSIQAQVINLLLELKEEFGLTMLFIAHDLSVVEHIADRIAVMYLGDIVETGPAMDVYANPLHPYTRSLIAAVPRLDPRGRNRKKVRLKGEIPSPLNKPSGCGFRQRCPWAEPACAEAKPQLDEYAPGRRAACIRLDKIMNDG